MKLDKVAETYNTYKMEVSFGELTALLNALEDTRSPDPVADEMKAAISFYLERVPGPGEDKDEFKEKKKAEKEMGSGAAADSDNAPILPSEEHGPEALGDEPGATADDEDGGRPKAAKDAEGYGDLPAGEDDLESILSKPPTD